MGTASKSHPWITFHLDLRRAPASLWILLGEAKSKIDHLSLVPLRPSTAEALHQVYLAKGVAATTAIEGNTLSEEEVLKAVRGDLKVQPSREYLKREVDNVIAACRQILQEVAIDSPLQVSLKTICAYNRMVLDGLPANEDSGIPGEIRSHNVVVGGGVYRGAPAGECHQLMTRLCEWLNGPDFEGPKDMETIYATIQAIVAHLYIAWIHPFGDGNGRTARLLESRLLLAAGVPTPAAHLLSNHYNQTRAEYYRQLSMASKSGGDVLPFLEYAVRGLVDGLREQLKNVWAQQWDVVWENYVHEVFVTRKGTAGRRQRDLALALGARPDAVEAAEIRELTPRLAAAYSGKTAKTLSRDVAVLEKLGLVEREGKRIKAHREVIFSFLPYRRRKGKESN